MSLPILTIKLFAPLPRPNLVHRAELIERLNAGLHRRLTLISAPAGFGKTTLVSDWIAGCARPAAWLSLDERDNDPPRFLMYLIAAVQRIAGHVGAGMLQALQSPQPPPPDTVLMLLLNDIATLSHPFVLVLDDYHVIESPAVDQALTLLLEHLPPPMHLVIATREDPPLPLARFRARDQVTELRAADLRFTRSEVATFLTEMMGLRLSADHIAALDARTEGWIAGLQLAAISLQGHHDVARFIQSFTGSHRFLVDYLVEEVLHRQPPMIQTFLLRTSILDRLCAPLCDAVLLDHSASGRATLQYLEQANLFVVPLDDERRWYRYHHLFAELLRQRLHQRATAPGADAEPDVAELHRRASHWYEDHGMLLDAFRHAAAANDIVRAERLIEGNRIPLHFRGAVTAILDWLGSLPATVLNARPSLWWRYASLLLVVGQTTGVDEKLQAAEAALRGTVEDEQTRLLVGRIATARSVLALTRYQVDSMLAESSRALEYLPHNPRSSLRATAYWTRGAAFLLQGDRAAAREALYEAITLSQAAGDTFTSILATVGLGQVQEADTHLAHAAETYRRVLTLAGDQPLQIIGEAHLGLARVLYEWNDLGAAEEHARLGLHLVRQYDQVIDRSIIGEVCLAHVKLAQGDVAGAAALLEQTSRSTFRQGFVHRIPEVVAARVVVLLRQGQLLAAAQLAQTHRLPLSQARVHLAQGDPTAALAVLLPLHQHITARGWEDERLKVLVVEALSQRAHGDTERALHLLHDALVLAEPNGFVRVFADEGAPMGLLLSEGAAHGMMPDYVATLLGVIEAEAQHQSNRSSLSVAAPPQPAIEPLSQRELEILRLIAQGLSNREIGARLVLALDTVKGHNRNIFGKLQVQRRTEAVARARELGLL